MATVHEWSGISLPLPFLLGLLSPDLRADLRRLNRFAVYDRQWLRAECRRRARDDVHRPADVVQRTDGGAEDAADRRAT